MRQNREKDKYKQRKIKTDFLLTQQEWGKGEEVTGKQSDFEKLFLEQGIIFF